MKRRFFLFLSVVIMRWTLIQGYIANRLGPGWGTGVPLAVLPVIAMFAGRARRVPFRATVEWVGRSRRRPRHTPAAFLRRR